MYGSLPSGTNLNVSIITYFQHWLSDLLYKNERNCTIIEQKISKYELDCLVDCQFCRVSESWDFYFDLFQFKNRSESLVHTLALKCAEEYRHEKSVAFQKSISEKAQSLYKKIQEKIGIQFDDEFSELFKTTTVSILEISTQSTTPFEVETTPGTTFGTASGSAIESIVGTASGSEFESTLETASESDFGTTTFESTFETTSGSEIDATTLADVQLSEINSIASSDQFCLGFNWISMVFAFVTLLIGAVFGFCVSYFCCPRTVYNVKSI
jgi:hypothetical protein